MDILTHINILYLYYIYFLINFATFNFLIPHCESTTAVVFSFDFDTDITNIIRNSKIMFAN